jgi:hypothetical protein
VSEPNRRELSRRGLLGPEDGWSLAPVAAWLAIEGRRIADPEALLARLAERLDAAGARIDRLAFSVATLNPLLLAWNCLWRRGEGTSAARCNSCASGSARSGAGSKRWTRSAITASCTRCMPPA